MTNPPTSRKNVLRGEAWRLAKSALSFRGFWRMLNE